MEAVNRRCIYKEEYDSQMTFSQTSPDMVQYHHKESERNRHIDCTLHLFKEYAFWPDIKVYA